MKALFTRGFETIISQINRFNDIMLAVLAVMIISLMIIPINPSILDALLALGLATRDEEDEIGILADNEIDQACLQALLDSVSGDDDVSEAKS